MANTEICRNRALENNILKELWGLLKSPSNNIKKLAVHIIRNLTLFAHIPDIKQVLSLVILI